MKMKRIALLLALVMLVGCFGSVSAFAASEPSGPNVRVNGKLVEFPDAKPFIDENSRTLIPVRFVAENLGAKVSWIGATKTANIEKDGILVEITIGDSDLRVTENGKTTVVKMDTAAVLKENRTFVPIRFVAEALGAYVDYSGTYRMVGIYSDVLTAEQIASLQALPYTKPEGMLGYEDAKQRYDADTLAYFYGTDRENFQTFANAREHLYHMTNSGNADSFYADVVDLAVATLAYDSDNMTVKFLADTSCIYQSDSMNRLTCAVRGIAEVELKVEPMELTGRETAMLCELGFTQLAKDEQSIPVDVHMNARDGNDITPHTIVPAGVQK